MSWESYSQGFHQGSSRGYLRGVLRGCSLEFHQRFLQRDPSEVPPGISIDFSQVSFRNFSWNFQEFLRNCLITPGIIFIDFTGYPLKIPSVQGFFLGLSRFYFRHSFSDFYRNSSGISPGFFRDSFINFFRNPLIDFLRNSFLDFFQDLFRNFCRIFLKDSFLDSFSEFFRDIPSGTSSSISFGIPVGFLPEFL